MADPTPTLEEPTREEIRARLDVLPPKVKRPSRSVAYIHGWIDEHLSREKVSMIFKTLLWVIPLTLLIWIYAERQGRAEIPGVTLPIEIVSNDPTRVFSITSPASKNIVVKIAGPRAALERFQKQFNPLNGEVVSIKIPYDVIDSRPTDLVRAVRVREDKRLADAGISVESAEPAEIKFNIDQIVEKEYRVEIPPQSRFGTPPKFTPETVKVRGPARVLTNPNTPIRVEADIASAMSRAPISEEPVQLSDVKLNVIGGDTATITLSPPTVSAMVTPVRAKDVTLSTVRVMIAAHKFQLDRYLFEIVSGVDTITNVAISGPEDAVNRLVESPPVAYVEVNQDLLTSGEADVPIRYNLPPGVVLKDERKTLRIRATPR